MTIRLISDQLTTEGLGQSVPLYDADLLAWLEATIGQLQGRDFGAVDWENLIDELEYMSRRERQKLESNLVILLLHLLKWQYQPGMRSGSWQGSIVEHRRRIRKALKASPSLKPYLDEVLAESYADAIEQAMAETGLSREIFPPQCLYAIGQILDGDFLPE
jgi:Domain of unknown function DUF29